MRRRWRISQVTTCAKFSVIFISIFHPREYGSAQDWVRAPPQSISFFLKKACNSKYCLEYIKNIWGFTLLLHVVERVAGLEMYLFFAVEGRFSVWLLRFDALSSMGPPPICLVLWKYRKSPWQKEGDDLFRSLICSAIKGRGTLYYLAKRGNLFWAGFVLSHFGRDVKFSGRLKFSWSTNLPYSSQLID